MWLQFTGWLFWEATRLTDEDVVVGRVGKDDGLAEQARGVVYGGSRKRHAGEGDAMILRPRGRRRSVGQARFSLRKVLRGRSCGGEEEERPSSSTDTDVDTCG